MPLLGGFSPVDESRWPGVSEKVAAHLVQLASEQGHQWKLVEVKSLKSQVIAGVKYDGTAVFEDAAGEQHTGGFKLVVGINKYEKLELNCAEQTFTVSKGQA